MSLISTTRIEFIDLKLRDRDTEPGFYVVGGPSERGKRWNGFSLWKSVDGGTSYYKIGEVFGGKGTIGYAASILPDGPTGDWDLTNHVDVFLYSGSLESKTEPNVLHGRNAGMLGDELILWETATLIASNTYRLSNLLRGKKGTAAYTTSHALRERFVALDNLGFLRISCEESDFNQEYLYKAVSLGEDLSSATATAFTNTGRGYNPKSGSGFNDNFVIYENDLSIVVNTDNWTVCINVD